MDTHRIETTLDRDGTLTLENLPFQAGETVEVIILPKTVPARSDDKSLRGLPVSYLDPFKPVADSDWDAAR